MIDSKKTSPVARSEVEKVVPRILVPFVLFVAIMLVASVFGLYWLQMNNIDAGSMRLRDEVQSAYTTAVESATDYLEGLIHFIENDAAIQDAWQAHDTGTLLHLTRPILDTIGAQANVSHFYFHGTDKLNVLRVHKPQHTGDRITRYTLEQAAASQQVAHGIELGVFGEMVLRVVSPWYIDGELAGYIELGAKIDHLLDNIQLALGVDIVVVTDKARISRLQWERAQGDDTLADWEQFEHKLVIYQTLPGDMTPALRKINRQLGELSNAPTWVETDSAAWSVSTVTALDARADPLGSIWVLRDVSDRISHLKRLTVAVVITGILLSTIVIYLFYTYLNAVQSQLAVAYEKLKNEIWEREQVQQQLESYSYTIAHDLRAPLRSITSFGQILQEDLGDKLEGETADALKRIIRAGALMARLIDDILDLSRISRKNLLTLETVNLSDYVSSALERLNAEDPARELDCDIEPGIEVNGSRELLNLALQNLVENAWKFTAGNPVTRIQFGRTRMNNQTVYFLRDNGVGFDMEYADKLFGIFQRLHPRDEFEGTGVGLASVKRVIERHKGRIWAKSAVGKGTTFFFTLNLDAV